MERAGDNAGAVFAPALAIGLFALFQYRGAFLLAAIPGLLAASCYLLVRARRATRGAFSIRLSGYPKSFLRVLTAVGVFGCAQFAGSLFTLRATQELVPRDGTSRGISEAIALYLLYNLVATAVAYPVGSLADRGGRWRPRLLRLSFLSFAAAAVSLALSSTTVFLLLPAFALGGAAAGAVEVAETALAGDQLSPNQRGAGFGVLAAVNGLGDFVASIWVTLVWTYVSAAIAFSATAGLAVIGVILAARIPSASASSVATRPT
jgi:MFS family permease